MNEVNFESTCCVFGDLSFEDGPFPSFGPVLIVDPDGDRTFLAQLTDDILQGQAQIPRGP